MPHVDKIAALIAPLLQQKPRVLIGIDGPAAAGKTTLASRLQARLGASVFHADDFFLRPEQRTPERLSQVGGNLDLERMQEELIQPLLAGAPFTYRPFDCSCRALGDPISACPTRVNVIEGSYSHHPYFGEPYDLRILLTISPALQKERILARSPQLAKRFFEEWIPKENAYFAAFSISDHADLILNADTIF